jgi:Fe-S-cluster-containing dehydrogenase component
MKAFNINVKRCTGCYSCQIGCKDEHVGNDWTLMLNHSLILDIFGYILKNMREGRYHK